MLGGIKEILIISTPRDIENFKNLFLDGKHLGLSIKYATQDEPKGIAQAITIGRDFINNDNVCLILGDNIFYGDGLTEIILKSIDRTKENLASIFAIQVKDPRRYGVVEISDESKVVSLEEKPKTPKTNLAATGIYFYPNDVIEKINDVIPSQRGELEITDLNKLYLKENRLIAEKLLRGFTWIDTGTHDSMLDSSNFIYSIQKRNGLKIACLEEIAFNKGLIDKNQLLELSRMYKNNEYGSYLKKLITKN
jgi:glucose-1-phosphate thymidylyltransferase